MEKWTKNQFILENDCTLDDIVFQNKNKDYGAYNLRSNYLRTINRAFFTGTALFIFGMAIPTIYASFNPKLKSVEVKLAKAQKINDTPPDVTPPVELPPPPPIEQPKVSTVALLPPEIVVDAPEENVIPEQKEFDKAVSGPETIVGVDGAVDIVVDETKKVEEPIKIEVEEDKEFTLVEQKAEFLGGYSALAKFLQKNLKYPSQAASAGISGKVFMSFVVDKNGEISDVSVIKGIGFGCDEEATRVVKAMPKWNPGKQSGRAVKSRFNLPIVFSLE
jgi:periplasmic protein TonB